LRTRMMGAGAGDAGMGPTTSYCTILSSAHGVAGARI
jgi:hypothetical protein